MGPCWLKMTEKMAEVLLHSSESMTVLARWWYQRLSDVWPLFLLLLSEFEVAIWKEHGWYMLIWWYCFLLNLLLRVWACVEILRILHWSCCIIKTTSFAGVFVGECMNTYTEKDVYIDRKFKVEAFVLDRCVKLSLWKHFRLAVLWHFQLSIYEWVITRLLATM